MQTIARSAVRRLASAPLRLLGLELRRLPSEQTDQFERVYSKYRDRTMLGREEYIANLRLSSTVRAQGCVIECGVWKGGTIAGMAEVLGADREYFLFDSFQRHRDPQPIDGPAALAWKAQLGSEPQVRFAHAPLAPLSRPIYLGLCLL